ncbi:unnamed protein product [Caenorhabditis angaria]|uniref:Uncharacterized protein n=1 Tax=Caenorhabditis angaria TaxID=860376 RepID=A0A9P1MW89_9PELO|nr:unnamed protein product [Caenorhabditis angaria]
MSVSGACGIPAYQPHHPQSHPPPPPSIPPNHQMYHQMDQNPTTSHPQQQQQQQWQQYGHHPQNAQYQQVQQQDSRAQYPRSPSRSCGPSNDNQTAHWMNQHYMNGGNWAYSASPVPSIAPSVISQYPADDRMSMLSVNTAITGHGQGDNESQRCFSSNGSTQENINPDMAFAQLMRETDYVLHNWFTIRDPIKRCELSIKLLMWIKNKGLLHLDETVAPRYIQQIVACVTDGLILWTPPDTPPPQEYIALACRLLEVFHKLVQYKQSIPIVVSIFSSTEGERSLKDLLCPFIPMTQDPRLDRCSYIVVEFISSVLQLKNADNIKVPFLKSLKFPKMVHMLIKHLHEAPIANVSVLMILRNIISRDTNIKEYLIRFHRPKDEPLPPVSLIRVILECVFPRSINSPPRAPAIISHTCHLLRTLLHDAKAINDFVKLQGINIVCTLLQRINDVRIAKDALNLFLHVSDSPAFQEVDVPLPFILNVMNFYQDEEIFKLGTGFLGNIVANKPRFKKDAIQNNAIQLLDSILCKFPRLQDLNDERKRQLVCEVMSNCLRTLINLLPFWFQSAQMIVEDQAKQNQIIQTINKLIDGPSLQRYMTYLSCDVNNREIANFIEVRSYILRFIGMVIKMPFVAKNGILGIMDENRKDNIVGHVLNTYSWASQLYIQQVDKNEKEQREKLIERSIALIVAFMDYCSSEVQVASQCRFSMSCPLDLLRDSQNESFIRLILEFCEKLSSFCEDIFTIWNFDRAMMEGLTNNRNANIAKAANAILSRIPVMSSEPLADVFANSEFY